LWLRSTALRLGCEFLKVGDGSTAKNVSLLKCINYIIHTIEGHCMVPRFPDGNSKFDAGATEAEFKEVFADNAIDPWEREKLVEFFKEKIPPSTSLVAMRAAAFKAAISCLSEDDNDSNVSLLRCINVVVHNFELICYKPKEYTLKKEFDLNVSLSDAVQQMWDLDVNRLTPGVDYSIDVQGGKKPYWKEDAAEDPLFEMVSRDALSRHTYRAFVALLDNYSAVTGKSEHMSSHNKREIITFLDAILETAPMQFCHKYLVSKHKASPSKSAFRDTLFDVWFKLYTKDRPNDSSGFEHVFVGEIRHGKVSGLHNWIAYYLQEKAGHIDYRGYIKPRGRGDARTNNDDQVLTLQFFWNGAEKMVGTTLIGTSPEFDFALYTTCFLLGSDDETITLDTGTGDVFDLTVKCYKHGSNIATTYPEALAHHD